MTFEEKRNFINQIWTYKTFNEGKGDERTITIFNDEGIIPLYGKEEGTEEQKTWEKFKNICYKKGMEIDDYWYEWLNEGFEEIKVTLGQSKNEEEAITNIELADYEPETDICTYDLTKWLNSNIDRVNYLGDALENGFGEKNNGFDLLTGAQWLEMNEVYNIAKEIVIEFLKN